MGHHRRHCCNNSILPIGGFGNSWIWIVAAIALFNNNGGDRNRNTNIVNLDSRNRRC